VRLYQLGKVGAAQSSPALGVRVVAEGIQVAPQAAREQHGCLQPSLMNEADTGLLLVQLCA
jgi:hypothetical protein